MIDEQQIQIDNNSNNYLYSMIYNSFINNFSRNRMENVSKFLNLTLLLLS